MSHIEHIASEATKGQTSRIQAWAKYEAAQVEFEKHRKKLIHSIMQIKNEPGVDFFNELHKRIDFYNKHQVMDRIARSVITGEALEEIHVKYVDEHVHQEKVKSHGYETSHTLPQDPAIEEQIEKVGVFSEEQQVDDPSVSQKQTETTVIESKNQEPTQTVPESTENKQNNPDLSQQSQAQETNHQSPQIEENPTNHQTTEVNQISQLETTQIVQQNESSPVIEQVKFIEEKPETLQPNSEVNPMTEVPVQAPQEALQVIEESKTIVPAEQTLTKEKKVEQKDEQNNEPEKEQKSEEKEVKEEAKKETQNNNPKKGNNKKKKR